MIVHASFAIERQYWQREIEFVAGLDEVGMGAWAGPVVAGAVVFQKTDRVMRDMKSLIRDSKMLSAPQRETAAAWVQENALTWAVGEASVAEIYDLNILQAARVAMRRAVEQLAQKPGILLVDGRGEAIHPMIPSERIIKGDQKSFSIAAASILAKVHRDQLMRTLAKQYPQYGFERHKGYGSKEHQEALKAHGACICHRAAYAPIAGVISSTRAAYERS